jgi:hypothetical protein
VEASTRVPREGARRSRAAEWMRWRGDEIDATERERGGSGSCFLGERIERAAFSERTVFNENNWTIL